MLHQLVKYDRMFGPIELDCDKHTVTLITCWSVAPENILLRYEDHVDSPNISNRLI